MEKPTSALSIVASPLALVLLALFGIAALLPAVTVSAADCNEAGSLTRETYLPAGAARPRYFTLYLPPCYENSQQS